MMINQSSHSPSKEFESWQSYWRFHREVMRSYRYIRSHAAQVFLETLLATSHDRVVCVNEGKKFYRSQVAHHDRWDEQAYDFVPSPALPERMKPLTDKASEGRVNPKGIPCLYLASDEHTAIAEARPWIGSLVSVGLFQTTRQLRIVDCGRGAERMLIHIDFDEPDKEPAPKKREEIVWSHIANAFREPVTRNDNTADYVSTQVISEIFRSNGFDGITYRSAFGETSYNIALFDVESARLRICTLHQIKGVKLDCPQCDNPYYVQENADGSVPLEGKA